METQKEKSREEEESFCSWCNKVKPYNKEVSKIKADARCRELNRELKKKATAQDILNEVIKEEEVLKYHKQKEEVVLSIDVIKTLKTIGDVKDRGEEVKSYNYVKESLKQADKDLSKCLKKLNNERYKNETKN